MYPRESGYCGYRGYPAQNTAWGLFHMRIMLTDFSIIGAHIQRLFAPSVSDFCTSQQKLDRWTRKIGHESRVSKDAILDRTLKNDVVEVPTAKNSSAIGESLAVGRDIVSFFKNPSRTSRLRRWLRQR